MGTAVRSGRKIEFRDVGSRPYQVDLVRHNPSSGCLGEDRTCREAGYRGFLMAGSPLHDIWISARHPFPAWRRLYAVAAGMTSIRSAKTGSRWVRKLMT